MRKAPLVVTVMIVLATTVYAVVEFPPQAATSQPTPIANPVVYAATAQPASPPVAAEPLARPAPPASAAPVATNAAAPEPLVTGPIIFFGCATGGALGAAALALPPMAAWAMTAGALPAVAAVILSSGIGCTVGLFFNVILTSVERVLIRLQHAWHSLS